MESDQPIPPTARIRRYVDDLVTRWPDITTEAGDDSPWANGPLVGNASGPMIYFAMITSSGPEVVDEQRLWVDWCVSIRRPEHFAKQNLVVATVTSHTAPLTPAMNTHHCGHSTGPRSAQRVRSAWRHSPQHHPLRNGLRPRGRRTRPFCNEIIAVATGSPTVDVVFRYVRTGHAGPADDGGQCAETAENQEHLGVTAEQAG